MYAIELINSEEHLIDIQLKLFQLGCKWNGSNPTTCRTIIDSTDCYLLITSTQTLYFGRSSSHAEEITLTDLYRKEIKQQIKQSQQ